MRLIIDEVSRRFGDGAICTGEIRRTDTAPILTMNGARLSPCPASWGFPKWDGKGVVAHARCETALQKPMFSAPLLTRRCVIPSTGFYEWTTAFAPQPQLSLFPVEHKSDPKTPKTKLFFRCPGESMLYMAGMVNAFTGRDGKTRDAFVVLTTSANAFMAPFSDRMPVILSAGECEAWVKNDVFMREVLAREGAELEWTRAG